MNFVSLLQSLEGGIYEVVAWAILFPKTMLTTIFKPSWGVKYVNEEWENKKDDGRFDEFLSPGLLWLLISVLQILFRDPITIWADFFQGLPVLEKLFSSFINLKGESRLAVQILILLFYPLFYLIWMEVLNKTPIQKSTLKRVFQIHCYALAPAQFLGMFTGLGIFFIWFYEIFVFRYELEMGWLKSIWHALVPQILLAIFVLGSVFVSAFF